MSYSTGVEGGGTLVLLAGGRIEVSGTITANGQSATAGGSGGSILLRGAAGVTILPGGSVTARGGNGVLAQPPWPPQIGFGEPGYVRLDAWGAPPVVQGTIAPAPLVLELPHLRAVSPPRIGTTWTFDVFAPENTPVFTAVSLAAGSGVATPFGPLGLDLPTSSTLALAVTVAQPSHDPAASVPWPIPNAQAFVGLQLWLQALALPPSLPARLSNPLAVTVQ